jgi:IclR family acetate operon transcriptional repressor
MTGSQMDRMLRLLELLAQEARGARLQDVADRLGVPKSAAHRLLAELIAHGYARQTGAGLYALTTRILSLGYAWLGGIGVADVVQPTLDRLAAASAELARYAVVDGDRLTWIAKAQGARFGLRLDPDQGMEAVLYCTATGHAWLASQTDEEAMRLVMAQGFGRLADHGPNAPRTLDALRNYLILARERGYAWLSEASAPGTAALAAPVRHPVSGQVVGVVGIAGPIVRLTEARIPELAPLVLDAAAELAVATAENPLPLAAPAPPIGRGSIALGVGRQG